MDQKPRCPDVAEAIVQYFRDENAVSTTDGIEITIYELATAIGSSQAPASQHLRRLLDFGIIILKKGVHIQGNSRGSKFFALAEGHEDGQEWRKIYYDENNSTLRRVVAKPAPVLASEIIKNNAKAASDKNMLEELIQTYARIKDLQEKVISVQRERDEAFSIIQNHIARIEELEADLKLESESAHKSQQEITILELNLREARNMVAYHDRRIAKNDERVLQPFAHR